MDQVEPQNEPYPKEQYEPYPEEKPQESNIPMEQTPFEPKVEPPH